MGENGPPICSSEPMMIFLRIQCHGMVVNYVSRLAVDNRMYRLILRQDIIAIYESWSQ